MHSHPIHARAGHRGQPQHHDPTPHPVTNRNPLTWFAVALVAGVAALVLG